MKKPGKTGPDVNIRQADIKDIPALKSLWDRSNMTRSWNDPDKDLRLALKDDHSSVFVAEEQGGIVGSIMCGSDGHRGWIYYMAVSPDHRRKGIAQRLVGQAEAFLLSKGISKAMLLIRPENEAVAAFYRTCGYEKENRIVMAKWLTGVHPGSDVTLDIVTTHLEMKSLPGHPPVHAPLLGTTVSIQRLHNPSYRFYRYLYDTVGEPWLWWERRIMPEHELVNILRDERVEVYLLSVGGEPAGYAELDGRKGGGELELAYFGLMPHFVGRALGPFFLDSMVRTAWEREPAPDRLTVHTCTLDHAKALTTYQRAGFEPVRQETASIPDPKALGIM